MSASVVGEAHPIGVHEDIGAEQRGLSALAPRHGTQLKFERVGEAGGGIGESDNAPTALQGFLGNVASAVAEDSGDSYRFHGFRFYFEISRSSLPPILMALRKTLVG